MAQSLMLFAMKEVEILGKSNHMERNSILTSDQTCNGDPSARLFHSKRAAHLTNHGVHLGPGRPRQRNLSWMPVKLGKRRRNCKGCQKKEASQTYSAHGVDQLHQARLD